MNIYAAEESARKCKNWWVMTKMLSCPTHFHHLRTAQRDMMAPIRCRT
jgi:hypothetical protein